MPCGRRRSAKAFFRLPAAGRLSWLTGLPTRSERAFSAFLSGALGFGGAAARAFDLGLHAVQVARGDEAGVKLHF